MKIPTMKHAFTIIPVLLINLCIATAAYAESVYHTLEFKIKPGQTEAFLELMEVATVDTRNFEGCEHLAILVDESDPETVFFYEIWESEEDHMAYQKWRTDTDFGSKVQPFLAGPPTRKAYTLFQD